MTETGDKLFQTVFLGAFGQDEELKQALEIQQVAGLNDLMIDKLHICRRSSL